MKTFITSINQKLYESYGKKFIDTWIKHAQNDIKLIICFEGDISTEINNYSSERLIIININTDKQASFLKKFSKFNEARRIKLFKNAMDNTTLKYSYNYRFDAIRFSFKIFSFIKYFELKLINSDFAWIHADIVCLKDFDSYKLKSIFPDDEQLASYLGRINFPRPNPYSECGFLGYNFKHPKCNDFINDMYRLYESGDLFTLLEWHDCMVFDNIRSKYEDTGIYFKNLSAHLPEADHPFMKTELANYFDHLKGPERKKIGHS